MEADIAKHDKRTYLYLYIYGCVYISRRREDWLLKTNLSFLAVLAREYETLRNMAPTCSRKKHCPAFLFVCLFLSV